MSTIAYKFANRIKRKSVRLIIVRATSRRIVLGFKNPNVVRRDRYVGLGVRDLFTLYSILDS